MSKPISDKNIANRMSDALYNKVKKIEMEIENLFKKPSKDPNKFYIEDIDKPVKRTLLAKGGEVKKMNKGGLAEATAKLKAKGMKDGGMAVKDKVVAVDKSPNSGLITVKGFGVGRRT